MVLADDASPTFMGGGYEVMMSMYLDLDKLQKAFVDGTGLGWHEHSACLFSAAPSASFAPATTPISSRAGFRPSTAWPSGCGPARAWPMSAAASAPRRSCWPRRIRSRASSASTITSPRSTPRASGRARPASATGCASRSPVPRPIRARGFDLVAFFDCLHDMGDPVGAARHVRETLAPTTASG